MTPPLKSRALQLLLPGTRERYQANVQLLSLRPNTATADSTPAAATLADPRDFELMARALLAEPETDPLQFVLTGFSLGLAGDMSARMNDGAVAWWPRRAVKISPSNLLTELRLLAQAMPVGFLHGGAYQRRRTRPARRFSTTPRSRSRRASIWKRPRACGRCWRIGDISAANITGGGRDIADTPRPRSSSPPKIVGADRQRSRRR